MYCYQYYLTIVQISSNANIHYHDKDKFLLMKIDLYTYAFMD
jgi:uncharacterized protein (DUF952 family)